jgi:hypothetical protein
MFLKLFLIALPVFFTIDMVRLTLATSVSVIPYSIACKV